MNEKTIPLFHVKLVYGAAFDETVAAYSEESAIKLARESAELALGTESGFELISACAETVDTALISPGTRKPYKVMKVFWDLWGIEIEEESYVDDVDVRRMSRLLRQSTACVRNTLEPV